MTCIACHAFVAVCLRLTDIDDHRILVRGRLMHRRRKALAALSATASTEAIVERLLATHAADNPAIALERCIASFVGEEIDRLGRVRHSARLVLAHRGVHDAPLVQAPVVRLAIGGVRGILVPSVA